MMMCWGPAEGDAAEPDLARWAPGAGLTLALMLSAGGWCLVWLLLTWGLGS